MYFYNIQTRIFKILKTEQQYLNTITKQTFIFLEFTRRNSEIHHMRKKHNN